jgi:hypothetical protein
MKARQIPVLVDASDHLEEGAMHRDLVHPVGQGRGEASELADEIRVPEEAVLAGDTVLPGLRGTRAQHEARKIHLPAVRRRVRAVVEAELALVAEVDDLLQVGPGQPVRLPVHRLHVEPVEHDLERRAQRQAPPTAVADVIHAP